MILMFVHPAKSLTGTLRLPGDKSISHRAAMFAAMASGTSTISTFAASSDCGSTLDCLASLGCEITRSGNDVTVAGRPFTRPDSPLDCGNSGTTMRLMSGILAGRQVGAALIGDESLSSRPMNRVIEPLEEMGAEISSNNGKAPLVVTPGRPLSGTRHELRIASAQIKSCLLLAGIGAEGTTEVIEPVPTRDHTERMLRWFGAEIDTSIPGAISIKGGQMLSARSFSVPGDISSAAFFMVAAASLEGSALTLESIGLNPSRTGIIDVLRRTGVDLSITDERVECGEPVGDIVVQGSRQRLTAAAPLLLDGPLIANIIDEIPVLAVLGTQMGQGLEIRGAGELRVKESDRIRTVVEGLRSMGADVVEFDDGLRVAHSQLHGARINSYGDHRIAMAFAVAASFAIGETEIVDADCVDVSFPGFFETLKSVVIS
ncbi:MAG: 3-phosphoshikimate 1-carboxyvinyltransferase [Chloracidobacterium sp.]|nr:3-phosphoshikimate 1-carboxyvinyltransferase [Chloracidobacterium sp.]